MKIKVLDTNNFINLSDSIFNVDLKKKLIHQIITSLMSNTRFNISSKKNRSKISGSNKKPWRQKGTGRARAGSIKSPIWRSGGVAFPNNERNYNKKINKKMYIIAIKSLFSELFRKNKVLIFERFEIDFPKTKLLYCKLIKLSVLNALIILDPINKYVNLASRNIKKIEVCSSNQINPLKLVSYENVIANCKAVKNIEKRLI
ncbi:MAG: 50S ribosomal protein L4 [Enterobacteriaceae bacterium]